MTFNKVSALNTEKVVCLGGGGSGGDSPTPTPEPKCTCAGSCTRYSQEFNENDI